MEYLHDAITVKSFLTQVPYEHKSKLFLSVKVNFFCVFVLGCDILAEMIASNIAAMHQGDIIHGDLTTSNMMLRPLIPSISDQTLSAQQRADSGDLGTLYMIDFGLSTVSGKIEDKGVDIYVLKRAFISTHPGSEALFEKILQFY